jgi:nucleoid DNA-binding protein
MSFPNSDDPVGRMEFQTALQKRLGVDYRTASKHLEAVLELIAEALEAGRDVTLTRFGTFMTSDARGGIRFSTGAPLARRLAKARAAAE